MSKGAERVSIDWHRRGVVSGYGDCENEGKCFRRINRVEMERGQVSDVNREDWIIEPVKRVMQ